LPVVVFSSTFDVLLVVEEARVTGASSGLHNDAAGHGNLLFEIR
jgi:hypothetical protein